MPDSLIEVDLHDSDRTVSREEFRRWYDLQSRGRFERVGGRIVAMAAERGAHIRVKTGALLALRSAVRAAGLDCQALADGATVESGGDNDFEPDATVNCGPAMADDAIAAPNPVIVVEVLSPGTRAVDTGLKLAGYFRVPSIAHYLVIHPTERTVMHHRRTADGIVTRIVERGVIEMSPPGLAIAVEDIYAER